MGLCQSEISQKVSMYANRRNAPILNSSYSFPDLFLKYSEILTPFYPLFMDLCNGIGSVL